MPYYLKAVGALVKVTTADGDISYVSQADCDLIQYLPSAENGDKILIPFVTADPIPLSDIRLNGSTPTTEEEFDEMIAEVFPNANTGSSGTGGMEVLLLEISATFAAIAGGSTQRLIKVTADETNNGDKSLYLHDGTTRLFLQTIA